MSTSLLSSHEQQFHDFLAANGHPLDVGINHDSSQFHYFKCPHGGETDARYKFYSDGIPSGYFKCWHCGLEDSFCAKKKSEVSSQAWETHRQQLAETRAQAEIDTQKRYADTATLAQAVFSNASEAEANKHGYLKKKEVENHGIRVVHIENEYTKKAECYKGTLLVPRYNANDELVNLERIYFDKTVNKYLKRPLKGGQHNGAYYLIGENVLEHDVILLAEGIATAFTVFEATGYPVASKSSCYNLPYVAKALRTKYPHMKLLIITDDDKWHEDIKLRDSGVKEAHKACANTHGTSYVLPNFDVLKLSEDELKDLELTDMNDLFVHLVKSGLDRKEALNIIGDQIMAAINKAMEPTPHAALLNQLLEKVTEVNFEEFAELKGNEKIKNSQIQVIVIDQILMLAEENKWGLCKQHDFIYLFNGEYWSLIEADELKTFLGNAAKKMGLRNVHAQHFNFKDQLHKQFMAAANLPTPEQSQDVININLQNGTFEVTPIGNTLKPFDQGDFMTYQLPFKYDPEAKAPLFFAYLNRVLPEQALQHILAEYLGYVFIRTSTLKLEKTLLLYGTGANGKSVFYEIVRSLLGEQNTSEFSLQSLTNENGYFRAMIANKLVNYASEINGKLVASIFKQLVSGEPVEARLPYGRPFTLTHYAKLIFNCNELPKDVEQTEAYFRRFIIIPFEVTIPESEQDKQLAQKIIKNELSGVFNWVLQGLERLLLEKHFTESETVKHARAQYEKESDSVKLYLEEEGYIPHPTNYKAIKQIYSQYRVFCQEGGFIPVNQLNFQKRLGMSKIIVMKKNVGKVAFLTNQIEYKNYD